MTKTTVYYPVGPRINGRLAYTYTRERKPFRNSNNQLYAEWTGGVAAYSDGVTVPHPDTRPCSVRYVVYSYGDHWPLHIWDDTSRCWYSNADKYSRTTSNHYTQSHPCCDTTPLPRAAMLVLARYGYAGLAQLRLEGLSLG